MYQRFPFALLLLTALAACGDARDATATAEPATDAASDQVPGELEQANARCRDFVDRAQLDVAETACLEALERAADAGEDTTAYGRAVGNAAYLFQMNGDYEQATAFYDRAIEVQEPRADSEPAELAQTLADYGLMAVQRGDADAALPRLERAAQLLVEAGAENSQTMAALLGDTAEAYESAGDMDKAVEWYQRSLDAYRQAQGEDHANVGVAMNNLGMALHQKEEYAKAQPLLQDAHALLQEALGAEHPVTNVARRNISDNAAKLDAGAEGADGQQQAPSASPSAS